MYYKFLKFVFRKNNFLRAWTVYLDLLGSESIYPEIPLNCVFNKMKIKIANAFIICLDLSIENICKIVHI